MKRLIGVVVVLAGAMDLFAAQSAAQNSKPRIGVLLPLTGIHADAGLGALEVIKRTMGDAVDLVERNTHSNPSQASTGMKELIDKKVDLVIGSLAASEVNAILEVSQKLPVISLANASPAIAGTARNTGVVTFTQPEAQLQSVSDAIKGNDKVLVMSTPFFSFKNDQMEKSLPKTDISKTTIVFDKPDAISALTKESAKSNVVIAAAADSVTAEVLLRSLKAQEGKGVILSPPPVQRTASVAADLVLAWVRQPNRSPASWSDLVASSPLYNKATSTLEVNWSVVTRGVSHKPDASTSGTKSCKCTSKDGKVTKTIECKDPPEKCEAKQEQDDCTCNCK